MTTQLLSGVGNCVQSSVVLCCLCGVAIPADARAQKFDSPVCDVTSKTKGCVTTWQIKGTVTVDKLPADPNNTTVVDLRVRFLIQKKAKGAAKWSDIIEVNQTTATSDGTITLDTGFINFNPAPAAGDQHRISVSGTWMTAGPPAKNGKMPATDSDSITPVP